jgi:hypothetical protein
LIIEYIFIKICTEEKRVKSGIMTLTMNALSTLIGVIGIPLSGLAVEILMSPLGGGTFQLSHWIVAYLVAILLNVGIEGLALKWIFRIPFQKSYWWLAIANAISIIICALLLRLEIIPMK